MDITPIHINPAGHMTATFKLESAVQRAGYGVRQPLKKLRALATLLDISIPKGLRTFRPSIDPDEYRLYDADNNEIHNGYDGARTSDQIKAEYIAGLIRKRVEMLNNPDSFRRALLAR